MDIDNIQTLIDTAINTTEPHELEPGGIYAFHVGDRIETIDLTADRYLFDPRRKQGTVTVEDLDSFIHYWTKHSTVDSDIFVDVKRHQITGILDAHAIDQPRWQAHRLVLQMSTADRWNDWAGRDRKAMSQQAFAEFIEDHLDDIREPAAADMLEIATTLQAATKVKFQSRINLTNGTRRLEWDETTEASAGKLEVPTRFTIGVAPFDWCDQYALTARFRYRIDSGQLTVAYLLEDPAAVIKDAVLDIVKKINEALSVTVMRGTPAS